MTYLFQLLWKEIKQCYSESTFWCAQLIPYFIAIFIQATKLLQKESAAEDACLLLHIGINLLRVLMDILLFLVYVEKGVIDFTVRMFPTSLHNFFHKYWSEIFWSKGYFTLLMNLSWKIARFGPWQCVGLQTINICWILQKLWWKISEDLKLFVISKWLQWTK